MQNLVWVSYVSEQEQFLLAVPFEEGLTAEQAIIKSALLDKVTLPEVYQLGIYGVKVEPSQKLLSGDRVEVYRPLKISPKEIRRNRAEKNPTSRYLQKQRARGNRFRHSESEL